MEQMLKDDTTSGENTKKPTSRSARNNAVNVGLADVLVSGPAFGDDTHHTEVTPTSYY